MLLGLFTGTAIGAGYLLAGVPNVELMTLIVALAGLTLGPWQGGVCGAVAAAAYSLGSPFGLPVPLLLAGQVVGLGLAGVVGAVMGSLVLRVSASGRRTRSLLLAGATGFVATFSFDLLTNLAIIGAFEMTPLVVLGGAVPFVLVHLAFNSAIFVILFPVLAGRLHGLAEAPLRGHGRALVLLVFLGAGLTAGDSDGAPTIRTKEALPDSLQESVSPADSLVVPVLLTGPQAAFGWRRPLWKPYVPTTMQWLNWRTSWIPVADGGLGAAAVIFGEAGTSGNPVFERDGVPLGTGHSLADDPWLVSNQGLNVNYQQKGLDLRTGADGLISLVTDDQAPDRALSLYRGVKGPHETYHRGISLLTPKVAWRLAFDFDESLDNEAYNFSDDPDHVFREDVPFPGHAKVRSSRARFIRNLSPQSSLAMEYSTGRKTKDTLPAWGAEHQEIWNTGAAAVMKARTGSWQWRTVLHWDSRDVQWGDRPLPTGPAAETRLLETAREGIAIDLVSSAALPDSSKMARLGNAFAWEDLDTTNRTTLGIRYSSWEVADTGASWLTEPGPSDSGVGQLAHVAARSSRSLGPLRLHGGLTGSWDSFGGTAVGGTVRLSGGCSSSGWKLELLQGGRAPRSDELLTPMDRDVNGRQLFILPNSDLQREKTSRIQALAGIRVLGFDFAVDASLRHLQEGITWVAEPGSNDTGRWSNGLKMNSSRVTGSVGRRGRFLGWGRIKLEGTWQSFDETSGKAVLLPPEQYLRLELMWENHFFREDGILQLALISTRRGEMADPWDLTRTTFLPETTLHDLLIGFRLVGTNLSLAIRNLTDQQVRLSAGANSNGREMDMRLHWIFHY